MLGEGTVVVVNEPGSLAVTDSVRVARARRALQVLGSVTRAQEARKLLARRATRRRTTRSPGSTGRYAR